jgi:hypothetical protein
MKYEYSKYETRFETELGADLPDIIHCVTAPPAKDDSEAEYERICSLSSAMQGWTHKYGDELIDEISDLLADMARHLVENCGYEEFNNA